MSNAVALDRVIFFYNKQGCDYDQDASQPTEQLITVDAVLIVVAFSSTAFLLAAFVIAYYNKLRQEMKLAELQKLHVDKEKQAHLAKISFHGCVAP